jgi:aspartyl-tRNA(Asn)/glutamyl-tRNA(Gln) amidotransferase subunit C
MSSISKEQVSRINSEQVEHIAKLARIELSEKEKEKFFTELSAILDYIGKLNEVDTSKIEPISQVTGLKNIIREDKIRNPNIEIRNKILEEAPEKKDNYFKVPKILE